MLLCRLYNACLTLGEPMASNMDTEGHQGHNHAQQVRRVARRRVPHRYRQLLRYWCIASASSNRGLKNPIDQHSRAGIGHQVPHLCHQADGSPGACLPGINRRGCGPGPPPRPGTGAGSLKVGIRVHLPTRRPAPGDQHHCGAGAGQPCGQQRRRQAFFRTVTSAAPTSRPVTATVSNTPTIEVLAMGSKDRR